MRTFHKKFPLILFVSMLLFACTAGGDSLDAKKKTLEKYKAEADALGKKIALLEQEIAKMDSSSGTGLKTRLVKIETVQKRKFEHFIEVQGKVDSDDNIMVAPEMPGVITAVYVTEGDKVSVGTVLATIDASAYQAQLAQVQAGYNLAKTTFEKQERLWNQKIGSEIQYLQAKTNVESLESQMKAIQAQISMTRLKSPINGSVDLVAVKPGEMANPGMSGVRVVNLAKMKISAKVADQYVSSIKKGDLVSIELAELGKELQTKISFVSQVIDPSTRSLDVEVRLDNKDQLLKPNMLARMKILDKVEEEVIVVPANLVQNAPDGKYLMVVVEEGGKQVARKRTIEAGSQYAGNVVVNSGLEPGDIIIVFGYQEVVDGQPVSY